VQHDAQNGVFSYSTKQNNGEQFTSSKAAQSDSSSSSSDSNFRQQKKSEKKRERNERSRRLLPLALVGAVVGSGIVFYLLKESDLDVVSHSILQFAAQQHLERLRKAGLSTSQLKMDLEEMEKKKEEDREEFEKFLHTIEHQTQNKGWLASLWGNFKLLFRFLFITYKFVPLMLAQYIISRDSWNQMVFRTLRDAGGCYIKLGQWMASRPDLFPTDLCVVLSRFHGEGSVHSFAKTKQTIEQSFGKTLDQMFDEFDPNPIGSGSIAQVYRAKLKGQKEYVAVKVRHPGIGEQMGQDLRLLQIACSMIAKVPGYSWMNLEHNILNFAKSMNAQIDMGVEAENLKRFQHNFRSVDNVIFPTPYEWNSDVLVEEYMDMKSLKHFIETSQDMNLKRTLAAQGVHIFLKQLALDNFVHSDLHVGNIHVTFLKDEDNPSIMTPCFVILDAGLATSLTQENRQNFLELFGAFVQDDADTVAVCLVDQQFRNRFLFYPETLTAEEKRNMEEFKDDVRSVVMRLNHSERKGGEAKVGPAAQQLLQRAHQRKLPIESNFTNVMMSAFIVEGVGRMLDPNLPFLEICESILIHEPLLVIESVERTTKSFLEEKIHGFRVNRQQEN